VTSPVHVEHGDGRLDIGDYPAMHSVEFAGESFHIEKIFLTERWQIR
jgi:hypothetical protein